MFTRMVVVLFVVAGFCGCGEPNRGSCFHRESGLMVSNWKRDVVLQKIKTARSAILRDNIDHMTAVVEASDSRSKNRSWKFPGIIPEDYYFELAYVERMSYVADNIGETDYAFVFGKKVMDAAKELNSLSDRVHHKEENCSKCVALAVEEIAATVHK